MTQQLACKLALTEQLAKMVAKTAVNNNASLRAGVVRRVAGLLAAMAGLGVLLFYVGLKYAFPNGI